MTWNEPVALGALIILLSLTACTGHAIVTHLLKTSLQRRKLRELKRYNDRQDKLDQERSVLSKRVHPASPAPAFTRGNMPGPSPFMATRYPAAPPMSNPLTTTRLEDRDDIATVIDIDAWQDHRV